MSEATIGLASVRTTKRCDGGPHGHEVPMSELMQPFFMCGPGGVIEVYCQRHSIGSDRLRRVREKVIRRRGLAYWMLWAHRWMDGCTAPAAWHTKRGACLATHGLSVVAPSSAHIGDEG